MPLKANLFILQNEVLFPLVRKLADDILLSRMLDEKTWFGQECYSIS